MLAKTPEERLSQWRSLRLDLEQDPDALDAVCRFWSEVSIIPFNHRIDHYNQRSWPTPWEILVENKYDDFTLAVMMAQTVKMTTKFANTTVDVRTMVDHNRTKLYNLVYVDESFVLNFEKNRAILAQDVPDSFLLENLVVITGPR